MRGEWHILHLPVLQRTKKKHWVKFVLCLCHRDVALGLSSERMSDKSRPPGFLVLNKSESKTERDRGRWQRGKMCSSRRPAVCSPPARAVWPRASLIAQKYTEHKPDNNFTYFFSFPSPLYSEATIWGRKKVSPVWRKKEKQQQQIDQFEDAFFPSAFVLFVPCWANDTLFRYFFTGSNVVLRNLINVTIHRG